MKYLLFAAIPFLIYQGHPFFYNGKTEPMERSNVVLRLDTSGDDLVVDKIYHLKEIQERDKYLKKHNGENAGVSLMIIDRPTRENSYYFVQAGYNSSLRFETYYTFQIENRFIKSPNFIAHLKILDEDGNYISFVQWRKRHSG